MSGPLQRIAPLLHFLLTLLLAATLTASADSASAQTLSVLSFNVEHLMSAERFGRWESFCKPLGWKESRAAVRPPELTYCNALDGTDGRGRRLFAPVRDRAAWQQKVAVLTALVREADADVVLLQEISDAAAARLILGPQYTVATTAELWRGHAIAQNIAVGWRNGMRGAAPRVELVEAISQAGDDGRRTRPGLSVTLDLGGGRQLAILNLHLKAGCRQGRLNEATSRSPERAFRRKEDCAVFQQQVPAIERWADDQLRQGIGVIVAGDFNRDLFREIRDKMPARADGGNPAAAADASRIASLVAEISDDDPPAAWFALIRPKRYPKLAECHRNIDSFLLSRNLQPWLTVAFRQMSTTVLPFAEPVSLERVRPSDHCPHLLRLSLQAAG
jgi:endonuclease/exonuclease/phosphatase family metal-dependent hydrolase